jgi:hypothetical protein
MTAIGSLPKISDARAASAAGRSASSAGDRPRSWGPRILELALDNRQTAGQLKPQSDHELFGPGLPCVEKYARRCHQGTCHSAQISWDKRCSLGRAPWRAQSFARWRRAVRDRAAEWPCISDAESGASRLAERRLLLAAGSVEIDLDAPNAYDPTGEEGWIAFEPSAA